MHTHAQTRCHMKINTEMGEMLVQTKENQRLSADHGKLEKTLEQNSSSYLLGGTSAEYTLILDIHLQH